jgi:hypothetical protein
MLRKILLILGLIGVSFGIYSGFSTFSFIKTAIKIDAEVTGYSSFQKLERIPGDCSAYRKACEIELAFSLPSGERIVTAIPQPIFSRLKGNVLSLLVDPNNPKEPRVAALHMLFRNAMVTFFLGVVLLFIRWLLKLEIQRN